MSNCGSRASSRRDRVVLPAPEGEERTSSRPRRDSSGDGGGLLRLLYLLHLFAELIDDRLQRQPGADQRRVGRLGAQRVGLAVEFLRQKIEPSANRLGRVEQFTGRLDMSGQAVDLL